MKKKKRRSVGTDRKEGEERARMSAVATLGRASVLCVDQRIPVSGWTGSLSNIAGGHADGESRKKIEGRRRYTEGRPLRSPRL
jgi:hypothetical protein